MSKEKITIKRQIKLILSTLHPSEAIDVIESIGKELRRNNSIRINSKNPNDLLDLDRPDLYNLKND